MEPGRRPGCLPRCPAGTGLEPGCEYRFLLRSVAAEPGVPGQKTPLVYTPEPVLFRTLDQPPPTTVYHVAPDGDDGRTPEQAANPDTPWRSLTNAARHAYAGVTVRAATGRYDGPVVVARSGTEAYPVVFEAEDGIRMEPLRAPRPM